MEKRSIKIIWGMFAVFIVIFILNLGVTMSIPAAQRMFIVLQLWALVLAIILLIKNKLPQKKYIIISLILSMLPALSYLKIFDFSMVIGFVTTLLSALAMFGTFNKFNNEKRIFLNTKSKVSILISVLIGIGVGIALGAVNYLLMSISNEPHLDINLSCFVVALSPAIYEEVVCRALFYAFCVSLLNGEIETRGQQFTCWFMMIMPHVIVHTPDSFIKGGPVSGITSIVMLALSFGLPLAILQRKRDITSSMIAHGLTDIIRFCFFGLPF
ncbi:CPBP family glutamic-type intramembrane protease [Clostridium sp.]|uniref:CPBP family glutamic-type intramembrane protease n=1 Tax=Clostridium sp. TaxID=1506 RepID=UPI003216F3D5